MVITSYTIKYNEQLYDFHKGFFGFLDKISSGSRELDIGEVKDKYDVILIGYDRIGYNVLKTLQKQKKDVLIVEYNPDIVRNLIGRKQDCVYGDISDVDLMERINLKDAQLVISTVGEQHNSRHLLEYLRETKSKATSFVTATRVEDALELYDLGADYVILPHFLGGHHVSLMLEEETFDLKQLLNQKLTHIKELQHRQSIGHEHPSKG
jgi:Trk K+ transport system NAD-binding subunit